MRDAAVAQHAALHRQTESRLKALGLAVRMFRGRRGMTQRLLAERGELKRTHVIRIEKGESNITITTLWAAADAMDVPLSELIAEAEALAAGTGTPGEPCR